MVKSLTSLTGSGVKDWMLQRVSAIVVAAFTLFLLGFFIVHRQMDYLTWKALFAHTSMRLFTLLALLGLVLHSWIGIWTVMTDYIKCTNLRLTLQMMINLSLLLFLGWGTVILWGL